MHKKNRIRIKLRIRKKIIGSQINPRLSVFRSSKEIYSQIIDDNKKITLTSACSIENSILKIKKYKKNTKTYIANKVGELLASRAISIGIKKISFDRNGYLYHGRIKALADGARAKGLKF